MEGIAVAVGLSLIDQVRHAYRPRTRVVVKDDQGQWQVMPAVSPHLAAPGVLVYRFEADLFYANASLFMEEVLRLVSTGNEPIRTLVFHASAINDVDYTAAKMLLQLRTELEKRGIAMASVATHHGVLDDLRRYGVIGARGNVYPTLDAA